MPGVLWSRVGIDSSIASLMIVILCAWLIWRHAELGMALLSVNGYLLSHTFLFDRIPLLLIIATLTSASLFLYTLPMLRSHVSLDGLKRNVPLWLLIVFSGWMALTYFLLGHSSYSIGFTLLRNHFSERLLPCIGIALLSHQPDKIKNFIYWTCAGVGLNLILYTIVMLDSIPKLPSNEWRAVSVGALSLGSGAAYAALALILGLVWLRTSMSIWIKRAIYPLFFSLALTLLIFSGSRTIIFATIVALAWIFFRSRSHCEMKISWRPFAFFIGCVFAIILFWPGGKEAFARMGERYAEIPLNRFYITGARPELWRTAIEKFFSSPIVGVGTGEGGFVVPYFNPGIESPAGYYIEQVHSVYLEVLSEQGLIGGLFFAMFALISWRYTMKSLMAKEFSKFSFKIGLIASAMQVYAFIEGITGGGTVMMWYWAAILGWAAWHLSPRAGLKKLDIKSRIRPIFRLG